MVAGFKMSGFANLVRRLKAIEVTAPSKALNGALNKGAGIVKKDAKRRAPIGETRQLRKKIKHRKNKKLRGDEIAMQIIGARVPHSHLVQLGTEQRTQSTTGRRTGRMEPDSFMADALRATETSVVRTIGIEMGKRMEKEAKK